MPTVVHLHGGHTPAESDGYPDRPGASGVRPAPRCRAPPSGWRDHHGQPGLPRIRCDQRAATLWYHDHRMDFTGPQVWRGLAGLYVVTRRRRGRAHLPSGDRGSAVDDHGPRFDADGTFRYPSLDPELIGSAGPASARTTPGVLGDVILVNGRPWPELAVDAARYRFRLINASNARRYRLALDPPPPEGPPSSRSAPTAACSLRPVPQDRSQLAPAERFDVIVDFAGYPIGTTVTLTNALGVGSTDAVMRFRVVRPARDDSHVPGRLAELEPLAASCGRDRHGSGASPAGPATTAPWVINGCRSTRSGWTRRRSSATSRSGDSAATCTIRCMSTSTRSRCAAGRDPWTRTVGSRLEGHRRPAPPEQVEVVRPVHRLPRSVPLHCHNLEHEDMAMMSAFQTIA